MIDNLINESYNVQDCRKTDIKCALSYPNVDGFHISVYCFLMKGRNIFNTVRIVVTCINSQNNVFLILPTHIVQATNAL